MLCPEVWNFSPPAYLETYSNGNWTSSSEIKSVAKKHYFNHSISVVLPDTLMVPEDLIKSLSDGSDYFKAYDFPLTVLLERKFLDLFVKSGQFTALSIGTRIDCDNCIAVTPSGHLILSLLKETYEEFGIVGKPSAFCRRNKKPLRYLVSVDLKVLEVKTKMYERIHNCLSRFQSKHRVDLILAWDPPLGSDDTQPKSVAEYFSELGICISSCTPKFTQRRADNVKVPILKWHNGDVGCSPDEIMEWLGAFCLAIDVNGDDDGMGSNNFAVEHFTTCGQTAHLQWRGFYTSQRIIVYLERLEKYISARKFPWAAVHVAGFEDAPISPGMKEHRWYGGFGDNSYTLFLHPSGKSIISTLSASQKLLKH